MGCAMGACRGSYPWGCGCGVSRGVHIVAGGCRLWVVVGLSSWAVVAC